MRLERRFESTRFMMAIGVLFVLAASAPGTARSTSAWVSSWSAAQMAINPNDSLPAVGPGDMTLRQLVRTTVGGSHIRIRVSNVFGREPLVIAGANIATAASPGSSTTLASTDHPLTFQGNREVVIPSGAEFMSDPVAMPVPSLSTVAVSIYFLSLPKTVSGHPGSRSTSFVVAGDQLSSGTLAGAATAEHWYFLSGVDVQRQPTSAVAVLGDSITDGHGIATDTDGRWTDFLAERLIKSRPRAVLNLGIGGNRLLEDGLGPNALARFGRDVVARDGVRYLIILEGVNDLGVLTRDAPVTPERHHALVRQMIAAYAQIVAQAHDRGIKVIGATVMPDGGSAYYHPDAANEADRAAVNAWIRKPGNFDAIVDFDALMRDPADPRRLRQLYDSGDGLHPSAAGYRAMGDAVPLTLFDGV